MRRDRMIGVKVSEEEHEQLRRLAFEARKSVAAYVRDRALDVKPTRPSAKQK